MSTLALCIPAYNAADHLPRLLESAAAQKKPFDEVLVYDDCSTDDTAEVARSYGATVVSGDENRGCSYGRAQLAEHASTKWVHFHDADDNLLDGFVEACHDWMEKADPPDIVLFGYEYRDAETKELINRKTFDHEAVSRDPVRYALETQINPFLGLYNRASFLEAGGPDLDPNVLYNEDVAMHLKLAYAGLDFAADPRVTVVNYRYGDSMSQANPAKCARSRYHVLKKAARKVGDQYPRVIARELWRNAGTAATHLDWNTAEKAVDLAVHLNGPQPLDGSRIFRMIGRISPELALRIREYYIRWVRPSER